MRSDKSKKEKNKEAQEQGITVVSPLTEILIHGAGELGGLDAVSAAAEKKHVECSDMGWLCRCCGHIWPLV